jgi:hypothetical protein
MINEINYELLDSLRSKYTTNISVKKQINYNPEISACDCKCDCLPLPADCSPKCDCYDCDD